MVNIGTIEVTLRLKDELTTQLQNVTKTIQQSIGKMGKKGEIGINTKGFQKGLDSMVDNTKSSFSALVDNMGRGVYLGQKELNNLSDAADKYGKSFVDSLSNTKKGVISQLLDIRTFVGQIVHYITFSIGVQLVMGIRKGFEDLRESFIEFEKTVTDVAAVAGYVGGSFEDVRKKIADLARAVSKDSIYSANEVADSFYDIASAGYDVTKMTKKELIPFTKYAAATQSDLAASTESVLTTLKSYSMDISRAGEVTDIFTQSIISSFLTMEKLKEGMAYVGPIAGTLGVSLDETVAALAALSERGMDGGQAGQRLTMVLTQLLSPTKEAETMLNELGLSMAELDPRTHSLTEILLKLQEANFSAAEASEMFRTRTAGAATVLVENAQEIGRMADAYRSAAGVTQQVADAQQNTLWGALKQTTNAITEQASVIGNDLKPMFISLAQGAMQITLVAISALGAIVKVVSSNWSTFSTILKIFLPIMAAAIIMYKLQMAAIAKTIKLKLAEGSITAKEIVLEKLRNIQKKGAILLDILTMKNARLMYAQKVQDIVATNSLSLAYQKLSLAMKSIPFVGWIAIAATVITSIFALGNAFSWGSNEAEKSYIKLSEVITDSSVDVNESVIGVIDEFKNLEINLDKLREGKPFSESIKDQSVMDWIMNVNKKTEAASKIWDIYAKEPEKYKEQIKEVIRAQEGLYYTNLGGIESNLESFEKDSKAWVDKNIVQLMNNEGAINGLIDSYAKLKGVLKPIIATSLIDEFFLTADAVRELTSAEEERLVAEYALYMYQGKQLPLIQDVTKAKDIEAKATSIITEYSKEYNNEISMSIALSKNYLDAQKKSLTVNRNVTSGINSMLTAIRSINLEIEVAKEDDGTEWVSGGSLDEWISTLEEGASAENDIRIATEKSNTLLENQNAVASELASAILEYGADSTQAKNAQSELNRVIEERVQLDADITEAEQKKIAAGKLYNAVLADGVTNEQKLNETEKSLLVVAQQLIDLREDETQALTDKYKAQAKLDALRNIEINFQKIYNEGLKKYFEALEKIYDIEEKLYKLRVSEDEQQETLFEKLAAQGVLTDEMIKAYIDLQKAQGGVLSLNYAFTQAMGDLTPAQREVVEGYLAGEKSLDDLTTAGITSTDIFVQYKAAIDAQNSAIANFTEIAKPLIDSLVDIGVLTADAATAWFDWTTRAFEATKLNWELSQSYQAIVDTMSGLVTTNISLLNTLITDKDTQSVITQIDELLVKLGLIPDTMSESDREAEALRMMQQLYGDSYTSLDAFSKEQLAVGASLLDAAKDIDLNTEGMDIYNLALELGIKNLDDLFNAATTGFANTDTFADATEDLKNASTALQEAATALESAFLKAEILKSLGLENSVQAMKLMLQSNFKEVVTTFGDDLTEVFDAMSEQFEGKDIVKMFSENFDTIISNWKVGTIEAPGEWDVFAQEIEDAPEQAEEFKNALKEAYGLDVDLTWDGEKWSTFFSNNQSKVNEIGGIFASTFIPIQFETKVGDVDWATWYNSLDTATKQSIIDKVNKIDPTIKMDVTTTTGEQFDAWVDSLSGSRLTEFKTAMASWDHTVTIWFEYKNKDEELPELPPDTSQKSLSILDMLWIALSSIPKILGTGGIFGLQKGNITKGPQFAMIGEAGPEAVIPLGGANKKYGRELLQKIIPQYFPDLAFMQAGGTVGTNTTITQGGKKINIEVVTNAATFDAAVQKFIDGVTNTFATASADLNTAGNTFNELVMTSAIDFNTTISNSSKSIVAGATLVKAAGEAAAKAIDDVTPIQVIHTHVYEYAGGGDEGHQKGGIYSKATMGVFGEKGAEALIPLEGTNRKYGEELLRTIIPAYYPDLMFQGGGLFTKGGTTFNSESYEENYNVLGPVYVKANSPEEMGKSLKYKYRASK